MLLESLVGGAAGAGALCSGAFVLARKKRRRLYGEFENRIAALERAGPDWFAPGALEAPRDFSQMLVSFAPLFAPDCFARLREEASRLVSSERNYVPGHKKGGTIAYETLIAHAPAIAGLYHSPVFIALASRIANAPLFPTPLNDQSSLSLLWYDRPGDHIGWHFDHNFYAGRHFTLLIPLINEGRAADGLSHAQLMAKLPAGESAIATPGNTLVMFEGARIHHKVTPVIEGERRMVLSMTYCADPRALWWQGAARRIKDVAFFGPRALWT